MSEELRTIRKFRERSNGGIKPWKTASCWKTTTSRQTSKRKSIHTSIFTIINNAREASTTSLLQTFTSGESRFF